MGIAAPWRGRPVEYVAARADAKPGEVRPADRIHRIDLARIHHSVVAHVQAGAAGAVGRIVLQVVVLEQRRAPVHQHTDVIARDGILEERGCAAASHQHAIADEAGPPSDDVRVSSRIVAERGRPADGNAESPCPGTAMEGVLKQRRRSAGPDVDAGLDPGHAVRGSLDCVVLNQHGTGVRRADAGDLLRRQIGDDDRVAGHRCDARTGFKVDQRRRSRDRAGILGNGVARDCHARVRSK